MLTRENIKQAIDAIGSRAPEIAYALNDMLGKGRIDVPSQASHGGDENRRCFFFGEKKIFVNKCQLFTSGTTPIEQALLIQYGEMAQKHTLLHNESATKHGEHALKTDTAGFLLMINYEIDLAADFIKKQISSEMKKNSSIHGSAAVGLLRQRLHRLAEIKKECADPGGVKTSPDESRILFRGVLNDYTSAVFVRFSFSRESLLQAARLNLEFFHIRFLLKCLVSGADPLLFACVAKGELQGLVFLEIIRKLFYSGFEVKYIATRRGSGGQIHSKPVKGAGTFLLAGVWMLWKTRFPEVKEIFLESELEAEGFYASIGFHSRGPYRFILKSPGGKLLTTAAAMAAFSKRTHPTITSHLCKKISEQIRLLKGNKNVNGIRKSALEFLRITLHPASADLLARTTVTLLLKNQNRIPEAETLLSLAKAFGRIATEPQQSFPTPPLAVVIDKRYYDHLMGVTHLENYRRIKAVETLLGDISLEGKWFRVPPRLAEKSELTWVHTLEYVEKIEKTAGKPLFSFDADTQTTETSWETARLAAGGVFSLLDEIMSGRSPRGFAFVRPPGHHAEAAKGMGFCIFNNIALGARYLKLKYGVARVMIIDIDAHHGNGTQEVFYDTDEVLFLSIHEAGGFPGTGAVQEAGTGKGLGFTINIPLEKGAREMDIGRALYFVAGPVAQAYAPEIILVSFGFDLYRHDRLAGMNVTPNGYALITALLLEMARNSANGRMAFVMEGGYSIQGIRECGLAVMKQLCNVAGASPEKTDRVRKSDFSRLSLLRKVTTVHEKYWEVLQ